MRGWVAARYLIQAVAIGVSCALGTACVGGPPPCGTKPKRPAQVRTPSLFGRVVSDPSHWTLSEGLAAGRLQIDGRVIDISTGTEKLGQCTPHPTDCSAFVGLGFGNTAAWVLLAQPPQSAVPAGDEGDQEIEGTTVWAIQSGSVVLVEGVALSYGSRFAAKLANDAGALRETLIHDRIGASLLIDPTTGAVVDAEVAGCM